MKTRNNLNQQWGFPKKVFNIFLVFIMLLFAQLTYLSIFPVIYGTDMDAFAKARNTVDKKLYAARGNIYDKHENILALNVASYTVVAYLDASRTGSSKTPLHVVDKEVTATALAPVLNMDKDTLLGLLNKKSYQVELGPGGRGITELKKEEIEDLGLTGIDFVENHKRYYPNGDYAAYILGYAKQYEEIKEVDGVNQTVYSIVGELGIEAMYNNLLKGVDGQLIYQRDRFGYKIPDTKETRINAVNGDDIYLTLDSNIQRFVEGELKEAAAEYTPEWLQLTVMDAKTGAILGTSSTPSFDPNIKNITSYENPLVSYEYEPGSTMKTYTYMCALEKGNYKGDDTFSSGSITIGEYTVNDWNGKGWGTITYDKGYEYSSNVGVTNLLQKVINKNDLRACLTKFGFGKKTDIELPRELVGSIKFNYPIEVAAAGFGQGITTTAVQQLRALTIIANNGKMINPYLVDKIVDPNTKETVYQSKIDSSEELVKTSTITKMKSLMHNVIYGTDAGTTGRAYQIEGFDIIGKTGTSQIYDAPTGKYLSGVNDYIYSFAGMYPKDDPEIIIYAAMKKPTWGKGSGLSKATTEVMKSVAKYLNMFSELEADGPIIKYQLPSYTNKIVADVKKDLIDKDIVPIILGGGTKIIKQFPSYGNTVLSYDKVFLITNDSNIKMPDIIGWSRSEIINLCNTLGVKYQLDGYGYVTSQSISRNTLLKKGDTLEVKLEEKFKLDEQEQAKET